MLSTSRMQSSIMAYKENMRGGKRSMSDLYEGERIYPVFKQDEQETIEMWRRTAWDYRPFLGYEWLERVEEEEPFIGSDAIEMELNPFEAVIGLWMEAVEDGVKAQEIHFLYNKCIIFGERLIEMSLITLESATNFILLANDKSQSFDMRIERLNQVISEFTAAATEGRRVCMCKDEKCYCC